MGGVFIVDMTHYEDIPPDLAEGPAERMAQFFGSIVSAGSVSPVDVVVDTALSCRRRPGRKKCPGHLQVYRDNASGSIVWRCSSCDDRGTISNWEGTSWDMRRWAPLRSAKQKIYELVLTEEELRELRRSLLGLECECLLSGAVVTRGTIVIRATLEDLDDLQGYVAAEANHEEKRHRRKVLDRIYEKLGILREEEIADEVGSGEVRWDEAPVLSPGLQGFLSDGKRHLTPSQDSASTGIKPIPADVVERTWQRMAGLSPRSAPKLIRQMAKEQPTVLAYLMAVDSDIFNQDERSQLLYLGVVVWQIMSQGARPLSRVTEVMLDAAAARNDKMAEYLQGETESGFVEATKTIISNYGQPEVLKYVIEALMEGPEEGCLIRDENKGIMLLDLKTVIDCLDT